MENLKLLTLKYIKLFETKNLIGLREILDNDVSLRDWEINLEGIESVLNFNSKLFRAIELIKINLLNIATEGRFVFVEMEIYLDKEEKIKVIDLIEFSKKNKIISIKAYKG